jgi:ubiquinol-cytochrome c reductase cytochrome c1 subunit
MNKAMTIRIPGTAMFTKIAALLVAGLLTAGVAAAEDGGLQSANVRLSDTAALTRGAKLFFDHCSGCHSLRFMRYSRIADDLHLTPDYVEKNFIFNGAKIGEHAVSSMPVDQAIAWFGKPPPDLSLEARAKGPDWIYTYLKSFYLDPSRPLGWNNTLFPDVSMPNALVDIQGQQVAVRKAAAAGQEGAIEKLELRVPGSLSPEKYDQAARDLTAFLTYVGEPSALQRGAVGMWVLIFLAVFTVLAYLLEREYWKDVH